MQLNQKVCSRSNSPPAFNKRNPPICGNPHIFYKPHRAPVLDIARRSPAGKPRGRGIDAGWTPRQGQPAKSSSISTSTAALSGSFTTANGVTAPLVSARYRANRSSGQTGTVVPKIPRRRFRSARLSFCSTTKKWRVPALHPVKTDFLHTSPCPSKANPALPW